MSGSDGSKDNVSNPFFGVAGILFDISKGNSYPGYVLEGDLWTEEERVKLEEFCEGRFSPQIRVGNAQFVIEKEKCDFLGGEIRYSAYQRSWTQDHIFKEDFEGLMSKLLSYYPEPIYKIDGDKPEEPNL